MTPTESLLVWLETLPGELQEGLSEHLALLYPPSGWLAAAGIPVEVRFGAAIRRLLPSFLPTQDAGFALGAAALIDAILERRTGAAAWSRARRLHEGLFEAAVAARMAEEADLHRTALDRLPERRQRWIEGRASWHLVRGGPLSAETIDRWIDEQLFAYALDPRAGKRSRSSDRPAEREAELARVRRWME